MRIQKYKVTWVSRIPRYYKQYSSSARSSTLVRVPGMIDLVEIL
jgi:hypothetical protein